MQAKAYSVKQFLEAYPISRTTLYRAWQIGSGPKKIRIGRRVLIPVESADVWVKDILESGNPVELAPIK